MSKITSISAPKVGVDMRFFESYSATPGLITYTCLMFLTWADYSLCWLEVWHFSLVCFTCNFVTSYCSGCCFQCCLVRKLLYQCTKYGAPNVFCSTLSSKSKSKPLCSCVSACSTVLEHGTPLIMYYRKVGTSL